MSSMDLIIWTTWVCSQWMKPSTELDSNFHIRNQLVRIWNYQRKIILVVCKKIGSFITCIKPIIFSSFIFQESTSFFREKPVLIIAVHFWCWNYQKKKIRLCVKIGSFIIFHKALNSHHYFKFLHLSFKNQHLFQAKTKLNNFIFILMILLLMWSIKIDSEKGHYLGDNISKSVFFPAIK